MPRAIEKPTKSTYTKLRDLTDGVSSNLGPQNTIPQLSPL